jgi:hypothetical protein
MLPSWSRCRVSCTRDKRWRWDVPDCGRRYASPIYRYRREMGFIPRNLLILRLSLSLQFDLI